MRYSLPYSIFGNCYVIKGTAVGLPPPKLELPHLCHMSLALAFRPHYNLGSQLMWVCGAWVVRYLAQHEGEQGYQEGEQVYQEGEYIQGGASQDYVHDAADGYQLAHPQSFDVHPDDAQQVHTSLRLSCLSHCSPTRSCPKLGACLA